MIMDISKKIIEIFNPMAMRAITEERDNLIKDDQDTISKNELLKSYRPCYYSENDDTYEEENIENFKKYLNRNERLLKMYKIDKKSHSYKIPVWYAKALKELLSGELKKNYKGKFSELNKLYEKIEKEDYSSTNVFFEKLLSFRNELMKEDKDITPDEIDIYFNTVYDPYLLCRMYEVRKIVNAIKIFIEADDNYFSKMNLLDSIIKNMETGLFNALWDYFKRIQKEQGLEEYECSVHYLLEIFMEFLAKDYPEEHRLLCEMVDRNLLK